MPRYSVLVPCEALILSGGLLRFAYLGRKLAEQGHHLCFVPFTERAAPDFQTALPVLSLDESARRKWDAVMIPGAGFADEVIEQFATFCDPRYGVRVQHILNDQSRKERFIKVNQAFRPEIVIFNNPQWAPGEHPELRAERFYHLFGAVDTRQFYPKPYGQHYGAKKSWVIGGLSHKNPGPLIEVLESLPKTYHVKLFGPKGHLERAYATLVQDGRLQLVGPLATDALIAFYHAVDCVVHTEEFAGWANLVAEAMACGLPVICTPHGTKVFATHGQNAIVLPKPGPKRIAEAVLRLSKNPIRCERLATAGRHAMMNFSWDLYAQRLLHLVFEDSPTDPTDGHPPAPRPVKATGVKETPKRSFISYPKSGRTWLRYILTELQLDDAVFFDHDKFEFNNGLLPAHNFDEEARLKKYASVRIVLLLRDPRDVMVSLFYQITGRFKDFFDYEGSISAFIRDPYFGAHNLKRFLDIWDRLSDQLSVLTIHYEDCHRDLKGTCQQLLDFYELSYDEGALDRAMEAASFEKMKALEQSQAFPSPWLRPRNNALKVRKGKVGGYLEELPPGDIAYLNQVFGLA